MAWFSGKVSLGGFPDLAGAVNKFQESVKNIEKNFDNALGFEEKSDKSESSSEASGLWPSAVDRKALFDPVMAFMGNKSDENDDESPGKLDTMQKPSKIEEKALVETDVSSDQVTEQKISEEETKEANAGTNVGHEENDEGAETVVLCPRNGVFDTQMISVESLESTDQTPQVTDSSDNLQSKEMPEVATSQILELEEPKLEGAAAEDVSGADKVFGAEKMSGQGRVSGADKDADPASESDESHGSVGAHRMADEREAPAEETAEKTPVNVEVSTYNSIVDRTESSVSYSSTAEVDDAHEISSLTQLTSDGDAEKATESASVEGITRLDDNEAHESQRLSSTTSASDSVEIVLELEKKKAEMKMLEKALQGAARQAQAKADEIAKLMNENEQLKAVIDDLKRKSNEAEIESLREEYHQRIATLERKVYALTKERDTLRREQNKKSDAAALLKEKDEIITQVMAEGEELSKKQAAQEAQIRKLRSQIRELEEEKKGLMTKLQAEENKVESIKKDKIATERLLQENTEKHQAELASQKEYYTNALTAAKEAQALAEERANTEARTELESRLKEAEERESMLVQALEELRQTLSRKEQQAVFREDMHRKDIEDLQKRYQASERRCEELVTQVPESTRPLLRQIEAMQETTARRAEAWAAVERSLNARLQEAEAKAAAAEERERSVNERLSQTLSRINVLEAQISCLRAEQTQLSKSLEKERQRAAENRQEYLATKEEADTQESRAKQLEEEIRDLKLKHKQELQDALLHSELLQKDLEREKATRLDLERTTLVHSTTVSDQDPIARQNSAFENGGLPRKLSSASSLSSMEESYFLQASLESSDNFSKRSTSEATMSPYYMKSMTPSAFEATLRQKEGELASYMSRLQSMESIRDSLAEELVKMTAQCEKLRAEASTLPGIKAELEALRRRHSAALELMGERDEELEELRADIIDLKEMYREQVNLLVNKIQIMSQSTGESSS